MGNQWRVLGKAVTFTIVFNRIPLLYSLCWDRLLGLGCGVGERQGQKQETELGGCYRCPVRDSGDLDQSSGSGDGASGKFVKIF